MAKSTGAIKLPDYLVQYPAFLGENWAGYEHYIDQTVMSFNKLTYPSRNCTIPSFDKIQPDLGKTLLGQPFTENAGIIGNKERFTSLADLEMEVRVFASANTSLLDVIEVYFVNNRLLFTVLAGLFTVGENITGGTSNAKGVVTNKLNNVLTLTNITGTFLAGEVITGGTSGATGTVVSVPNSKFWQITENTNPIPRGFHEYYFDSWFDSTLNNLTQPTIPAKNLPRLVWVNGYKDTSNPVKGAVYSWTGGIALITAITGTSITIDVSTSWTSLGFTTDASGNAFVIINGVSYTVPVPADFNTSTINVASSIGVSVGDFAFSKIETDVAPIPFDVCRQTKGYMYYGNWTRQRFFQSNAFNASSTLEITVTVVSLNDLLTNPASAYTGIIQSVFNIVIDSVGPSPTIFTGSGANGLIFNTGGYSLPGNANIYSVVVNQIPSTGNDTIIYTAQTGPFFTGETLTSTSGGTGVVVIDSPTTNTVVITFFLGTFNPGDTITGGTSGATGTVVNYGPNANNFLTWEYIAYKNGVQVAFGPLQSPTGAPVVGPQPIADGITFTIPSNIIGSSYPVGPGPYTSYQGFLGNGDTWTTTISSNQTVDTFKWQKDGGAFTTLVPITGAYQTLSDGVQIKLLNLIGHKIGDFWNVTAFPSISRAFDNFYYSAPVRRPFEGYIYTLPDNFWTMDTQEDTMYVNSSFGKWGTIDTKLSADLLSESVIYNPLKQASANKVLYPYLTGHNNDELIYIDSSHAVNTMGRKPLIELPQTGYLSDPVKLDFLAASFVGGRIKYVNKRLYFSSPQDGITFVFDDYKKYWQPPKDFPEVGLLSIIGTDLVCHSNTRNQSFTMFTNKAGDNDQSYTVEIRTPFTSLGDRWHDKVSSMSFIEGYITGAPQLIHTAYLGVSGCGGIFPHDVSPIVCVIPDRAPFGEGPFGSHPNGSDVFENNSYFQEIYKDYNPNLEYYFISLGITCSTKSHTYEILTLGMNAMSSLGNNNDLLNQTNP